MTNISFYKLAGDQNLAFLLICQLVKKARKQDQQVLCLMPGESEVMSLDKAMWASEPSSFLPHGTGAESSPIAVSCDAGPGDHHQVLIIYTLKFQLGLAVLIELWRSSTTVSYTHLTLPTIYSV